MRFSKFLKAGTIAATILLPFATFSASREGEVWVWGSGRNGQLGVGLETNSSFPREIKNLKFIDISAGKSISAAVSADGKLYTWGKNRNGSVGHQPPNLNVLLPKKIQTSGRIVQVSCGTHTICAVTESGQAYIWGLNQVNSKFRQIGTSETTRETLNQVKPLKINIENVKQVSCAGDYTTLVNKEGRVFLMGQTKMKGKNGQISKSHTDVIEVDIDDEIQRVESGVNFSLALNRDGKVYVWGDNKFGQLGTGSLKSVYDPTPLDELYREKVVDISCGDNYAGAVTEDGKVYTWGFGNEGQLGHGDKSDQFLPRKINLSSKISRISCGGAHTALLTDNGKLFMMGRGREGQLGREVKDEGSSGYSLLLKLVEQLPTNKKITKVRCGTTHTMTLMEQL